MTDAYINSGSYYNPNRARLNAYSRGVNLHLSGLIRLSRGAGAANAKDWRIAPYTDDSLRFSAANEAFDTFSDFLVVSRTGGTVVTTTFPGYVAARRTGVGTQLQFANHATNDEGGYLTSLNGSNFNISGGARHDGTNWIARATSAAIIAGGSGSVAFYASTGLTVGVSYTPTLRGGYDPTTFWMLADRLSIRKAGSSAQLQITNHATNVEGLFLGTTGAGVGQISAGGELIGGGWIARHTAISIFSMSNGAFEWHNGSGAIGASFTPTLLASISAAGALSLPFQPRACVYNGSGTMPLNAVYATLTAGAEYDPLGAMSGSVYTVPVTGDYRIAASVQAIAGSTPVGVQFRLLVNGVAYHATGLEIIGGDGTDQDFTFPYAVSIVLPLTAGWQVSVQGTQASASSESTYRQFCFAIEQIA